MSESGHSDKPAHLDAVWQPGIVTARRGDEYLIEMDALEHCQRCLAGQGCGAGVFSQLFARNGARLTARSSEPLAIGERVRVGVSPNGILKASLALYAWPLALFLLTLIAVAPWWLDQGLWGGEWAVLLLALLVAGSGIKVLGRLRFRALNPTVLPLSCHQAARAAGSPKRINE